MKSLYLTVRAEFGWLLMARLQIDSRQMTLDYIVCESKPFCPWSLDYSSLPSMQCYKV